MKKKKTFWFLGSLILVPITLLLLVFFSVRMMVASEGYDTNEAAWNFLFRNGEIRIRLQDGSTIKSYTAENTSSISKNEAWFKAGYGIFSSELKYVTPNGEEKTIKFVTDKLNNWNRVLYIEQKDGSFDRFDNGVKQKSLYQGP